MTTLLVVNPAAGRGRAGRLKDRALDAASIHWRDVRLIETAAPGDAVTRVRTEVERGAARVLVLGGDGTVHEAANGLLAAKVDRLPPLGVIPAGTGNDYAKLLRTHGFDVPGAIARLAHGQVQYFDVGWAWDEYFINAMGVGLDAEVARRVSQFKGLSGPPAYLAALAQAYFSFDSFPLSVAADRESFEDFLLLLEIGIGPVVGGGFRLTPQARPDDGLFDVCAISRLGPLGFITKLPLAMVGRHTALKQVRTFRTRSLRLEGRADLLAQLDGEVRSRGKRIDIRLEPQRLPVLVAARRPSAQWNTLPGLPDLRQPADDRR